MGEEVASKAGENPLLVLELRLQSLRQLTTNWNSYGAETPNEYAIISAQAILSEAHESDVLPARIDPSAEGGVVLSYSSGERYCDIECFNSGEVMVAKHVRGGEPIVWNIATDRREIRRALCEIRDFIQNPNQYS